ncbi:hypothetical protein HCH_04797 [Hahella chejuensis KCTC 2396]|uniref:Uncharacterized protein n=1 Tax=Hahella chejuensis (strain KCTC 2396) TaxID=349521 RepID=Q2SCY3_HAHCH|nr:hypothetical protein HCH_04797 [Hahella chejuensis KCTC 2396]
MRYPLFQTDYQAIKKAAADLSGAAFLKMSA